MRPRTNTSRNPEIARLSFFNSLSSLKIPFPGKRKSGENRDVRSTSLTLRLRNSGTSAPAVVQPHVNCLLKRHLKLPAGFHMDRMVLSVALPA